MKQFKQTSHLRRHLRSHAGACYMGLP